MALDVGDIDLGSTGVVLLPDQSGTSPTHLMFCGGKDGNIYLLNRDNLGKYMQLQQQHCPVFPVIKRQHQWLAFDACIFQQHALWRWLWRSPDGRHL